jgi:protein-S-isoprenylcysteine O-methyltransferase Ste14
MGDAPRDRNRLRRRAYRSVAIFIVVLAVCLFLPALTLAWWQAWTYVLVFAGTAFAATLYLLEHAPELVAHRLRAGPTAEKEPQQKRIQGVLSVVFVLLLIVPGLDHLFGWSRLPNAVVLAADVVVVVGFWIVFRTFQENSFASSIVEVREGQRVVTTGPYAVVRHPMYAGALLLILVTPLALGSWWGLSLLVPAVAGIVWRLLEEERFLVRELPGYADYRWATRYRWVPLIW